MRICEGEVTSCMADGAPACARILDPGARTGKALEHLAQREIVIAHRWLACHEALFGAGADRARATRSLMIDELRALATARREGRKRVCECLLQAAASWERAGVALAECQATSQLLAEVWSDSLCEDSASEAEAREVRRALGRYAALRTSLMTCGYTGGDAPQTSKGDGGRSRGAPVVRCGDASYGLVGGTPAMQGVQARIAMAARARETVLIEGETGTGKELVARAIHAASGDPPDRFVAVNCAAIPRELAESELFGHRRGAFSGASADSPGLVRAASGGTLLLDEISELSIECQAKLLRVLQERVVRPIGDAREHRVDVRFVAASNRPLRELIEQGGLRRDLFFRLQRTVINMPPLRERLRDLPALVEHLVERWKRAYRCPGTKVFSAEALARLERHRWPGNVRELENVVFAACLAAPGAVVGLLDVRTDEHSGEAGARSSEPPGSLREAEKSAITDALREANGNKTQASRVLGISRKQLYVKLRAYGLEQEIG